MSDNKNIQTTEKETNQQIKKERFEFILTVNDNIICQRYFRINGFKARSFGSEELTYTFNKCVDLIKNDLTRKSNIFLWYTSPQVFDNKEEMMDSKWRFKENRQTYIVLRDSDETYIWNGHDIELNNSYFNRNDYVGGINNDVPCVLKLAFLDNGREVISACWDGNVYPRFVRTNIDLSNSKNKYESGPNFSPFESALIKIMNEGQTDLVSKIIKELCVCCSYEDTRDYTTTAVYGDKEYNLNMYDYWNKYVSSMEQKYRKKTEKYMRAIS